MKSRSTSLRIGNRGFTLLEVMVVIGLIALMLAMGIFVSFDIYRSSLSRNERDVVAGLLARARSSAMANIYDTPWGVCYIAPNYIMFRGTACTAGVATNEVTQAGSGVTLTGMGASAPVVFTQVSGTTTAATITVTQASKTSTISVNYEGAIQ